MRVSYRTYLTGLITQSKQQQESICQKTTRPFLSIQLMKFIPIFRNYQKVTNESILVQYSQYVERYKHLLAYGSIDRSPDLTGMGEQSG